MPFKADIRLVDRELDASSARGSAASESARRVQATRRRKRLENYRNYLVAHGWKKDEIDAEVERFREAGCPKGRKGTEYKPTCKVRSMRDVRERSLSSEVEAKARETAEKSAPISIGPEEEAVIRAGLMVTDRDLYVGSIGINHGFSPYAWQVDVLHSCSKRKCILGARQAGKSTIVSSIPCHTAKYFDKSLCLIFAPTQEQSIDDMAKVKEFISMDPSYPKLVRDSADSVELVNGSKIQVVTASDHSSRGKSHPRCIVIDEASRVDDVTYMSAIRPMLNSNPDCELVLISTPNGKQGFFYRACTDPMESFWERFVVVSPFTPDESGYDLLDIRKAHGQTGTLFDDRKLAAKALGARNLYISPRSDHYDEQKENLIAMGPTLYLQEFCCQFVEQQEAVFTYSQIEDMRKGYDLDNPLFPDSLGIGTFEEVG